MNGRESYVVRPHWYLKPVLYVWVFDSSTRCAVEIPAGAFVCEYAGEVLTEAEADATRKDSDDYIFSLDHFEIMYRWG